MYRTLLATKRTCLAELQFGLVFVTLPLTIHTGLLILASHHAFASRLHLILPLWLLLAVMLVCGAALSLRGLVRLVRVNRRIDGARLDIERDWTAAFPEQRR
ncbi:MAG TPA: hypothetical protein VEM76_19140 [Anaeromyxobacteraceae bacterium]|nr:hypothetical protein [Anaeromyxobacteraceae bacterium]